MSRGNVIAAIIGALSVVLLGVVAWWIYRVESTLTAQGGAVSEHWIGILLHFVFSGAFGGILYLIFPYDRLARLAILIAIDKKIGAVCRPRKTKELKILFQNSC